MIKNYLKIALRNLIKHKAYSVINVAGLAIGITCCFLIISYVVNELQFERFHENRDRIYRVTTEVNFGGRTDFLAMGTVPLLPIMDDEIPEVEHSVRFSPERNVLISYENNRFQEPNFYFADSTLFEVFTFPLKQGDPNSVLSKPFTMVITEEMAQKYFSDDDPIGKVLKYENEHDFEVTGILQNIPPHTQLRGDFFASFSSKIAFETPDFQSWGRLGETYNYILLIKGANPSVVEEKIPGLLEKHVDPGMASIFTFHLQPLKRVYLHSDLMGELRPKGNIGYVYLFSAIAILILLIACINFMNLSTARSMHRAREVSLRKTFGANRQQIINQFLGESIAITSVSLLLSVALFELLLPVFNRFVEKELSTDYLHQIWMIPGLVVITMVVGLIAGSYPAFFLSRFQPVKILKSSTSTSSTKSLLRRTLVVFQFAISITLIVATSVVFSQLHFVKNTDLGFEMDHVVILQMDTPIVQQQYEPMKRELLQDPNIIDVAGAFSLPANGRLMKTGVTAEGLYPEKIPPMQAVSVDYDYVDVLGLEMVQGRNFSKEFSTDERQAVILNQTAVNTLGWQDPIGKQFSVPGECTIEHGDAYVIGVVKDFHLRSMRETIEPMFMFIKPSLYQLLAVRVKPQDISGALASIERIWGTYAGSTPFNYSFIEEDFDEMYRSEAKLSQIFTAFSLLAVFIGCLGLFGLTAFAAEQRTKEIGIRKVLGASVTNIVGLLSKEFVILVIAANVIAWPIAYYSMNKWLENFVYHIEMSVFTFVMAALIALVIAVGTMSFQAIRAALSNPVDALRYE